MFKEPGSSKKGNYDSLDKQALGLLFWLGQAGLLIGVIVFFVYAEGTGRTLRHKFITEGSVTKRLAKHVEIIGVPINVYGNFSVPSTPDPLHVESFAASFDWTGNVRSKGKNTRDTNGLGNVGIREVLWQLRPVAFDGKAIGVDQNLECSRSSTVVERDNYLIMRHTWPWSIIWNIQAGAGHRHIKNVHVGTQITSRGIAHHGDGLFQADRLNDESPQLQQSYSDTRETETDNPPVGIGGILFLFGLLGGFGLALAGVEQIDGERPFVGPALICCGFLLAILGSLILLGTFDALLLWILRACSHSTA